MFIIFHRAVSLCVVIIRIGFYHLDSGCLLLLWIDVLMYLFILISLHYHRME